MLSWLKLTKKHIIVFSLSCDLETGLKILQTASDLMSTEYKPCNTIQAKASQWHWTVHTLPGSNFNCVKIGAPVSSQKNWPITGHNFEPMPYSFVPTTWNKQPRHRRGARKARSQAWVGGHCSMKPQKSTARTGTTSSQRLPLLLHPRHLSSPSSQRLNYPPQKLCSWHAIR